MSRVACVSLAAVLSVMLFMTLMRAPLYGQGQRGSTIAVTLMNEREPALPDPPQTSEPTAASLDYPVSGRDRQRTGRTEKNPDRDVDQGTDDYLPASQLSERPQVLQDIDSEWRLPGVQLPVLVGLLLINEYGDVDRVLLRERRLSPMLEEDIRSRFLAMRFSPGRLHQRPVKTALRIEVRLE